MMRENIRIVLLLTITMTSLVILHENRLTAAEQVTISAEEQKAINTLDGLLKNPTMQEFLNHEWQKNVHTQIKIIRGYNATRADAYQKEYEAKKAKLLRP